MFYFLTLGCGIPAAELDGDWSWMNPPIGNWNLQIWPVPKLEGPGEFRKSKSDLKTRSSNWPRHQLIHFHFASFRRFWSNIFPSFRPSAIPWDEWCCKAKSDQNSWRQRSRRRHRKRSPNRNFRSRSLSIFPPKNLAESSPDLGREELCREGVRIVRGRSSDSEFRKTEFRRPRRVRRAEDRNCCPRLCRRRRPKSWRREDAQLCRRPKSSSTFVRDKLVQVEDWKRKDLSLQITVE